MDNLAELNDPPPSARTRIADLQQGNRTLRGTVAVLRQRLGVEKDVVAEEQLRLGELREANQHLVLATFGAQDSATVAEAAHRKQQEFLSMLAHELRNPMASITVAGSVIENLKIDHPPLAKMMAIVQRQVNHLLRLVDDLLDGSRINTGKISLQAHHVALSEIVDCAMETAHGFLVKQAQTVTLSLPTVPVYLNADLVRLAQLFSNLLINASKYSAPGETISISASVSGSVLEVIVKDNGKGIARQYQSVIFDLFAQVPGAHDHAPTGGLGVGLALVRTVAQMHGGAVRVESDGEGCGSAFIVTLPLPDQALCIV